MNLKKGLKKSNKFNRIIKILNKFILKNIKNCKSMKKKTKNLIIKKI